MAAKDEDPRYLERRAEFNNWLRKNGEHMKFYKLPPQDVSVVHEMLRKAFMAGAKHERRQQAPVSVGGCD